MARRQAQAADTVEKAVTAAVAPAECELLRRRHSCSRIPWRDPAHDQ
ncbi:hypothetical protein [Paenibacillus mendelii]|uniref:Uncharacterized protein n=1 Tax=Paenibacillus mendelii TaxID=206163 RepID=A0ABV6J9Y1_9BACL|nr:hypothetical protein [Paenibacillus mendelii]MCQ6561037.1 hypothetical protein [Paenibacillus mendelii]